MTKNNPSSVPVAQALLLSKKNKLNQKEIVDETSVTSTAVNLYRKGMNPIKALQASEHRFPGKNAETIRRYSGKNLNPESHEKLSMATLTAAGKIEGKVIHASLSGLKAKTAEILILQCGVLRIYRPQPNSCRFQQRGPEPYCSKSLTRKEGILRPPSHAPLFGAKL